MLLCKVVLLVLTILTVIALYFMFAIMFKDLKTMKFLAKHGVAVFSGKEITDYKLLKYINNEGLGWIHIPNVCYAPIMQYVDGKYKNHNFLQKDNMYGEIYLSEGNNSKVLSKIALKSCEGEHDYVFKDLSILDGSSKGVSNNLRHANFSNLGCLSDFNYSNNEIVIVDNGHIRKFEVLGLVEQSIDTMKTVEFSTREEFLDYMLHGFKDNNADILASKKKVNYDNNIIILRSKYNISNQLVFLIEIK